MFRLLGTKTFWKLFKGSCKLLKVFCPFAALQKPLVLLLADSCIHTFTTVSYGDINMEMRATKAFWLLFKGPHNWETSSFCSSLSYEGLLKPLALIQPLGPKLCFLLLLSKDNPRQSENSAS